MLRTRLGLRLRTICPAPLATTKYLRLVLESLIIQLLPQHQMPNTHLYPHMTDHPFSCASACTLHSTSGRTVATFTVWIKSARTHACGWLQQQQYLCERLELRHHLWERARNGFLAAASTGPRIFLLKGCIDKCHAMRCVASASRTSAVGSDATSTSS